MPVPAPMLATAGRPPDDPGRWAFEMKWDGMRAITTAAGGTCRFFSRNMRDVSRAFPELTAAVAALAGQREMIIDGEIIAPEPATGAPSFARLQHRMHVTRPAAELIRAFPVQLFVFDLLELDGRPLMTLPYLERRSWLADSALTGPLVSTPPFWTDVDAATMLDLAREHQLEGIL
ncbi:hypothetical protein [Nocardia brasiliensis]|uniref:ATP-dependent DNA ligase n=1 Tax=Nocardia brasiliensis TaxID=37326 RepID=UPI00366EEE4B